MSAIQLYPNAPPVDPAMPGDAGGPAYEPCLSGGSRVLSNQSGGAILLATANGRGDGVDFLEQPVLAWCLDEVDAQVWMRNPDWERAMAAGAANGTGTGRAPPNATIPMLIPVQGKINPKQVTLHLACEVPSPTGTQGETFADARWRIEWSSGITGSGGPDAPQQAIVDPDLGTVLQLSATRINVFLQYPLLAEAVGVSQPRLNVRASVGIGARPAPGNGSPPRRTIRLGTVDAAQQTAMTAIPQWASHVAISNDQPNVPTMRVNQFSGANGVAFSSADVGKHDSESVPIALGARTFRIVNNGAAAAGSVAGVFYLAL